VKLHIWQLITFLASTSSALRNYDKALGNLLRGGGVRLQVAWELAAVETLGFSTCVCGWERKLGPIWGQSSPLLQAPSCPTHLGTRPWTAADIPLFRGCATTTAERVQEATAYLHISYIRKYIYIYLYIYMFEYINKYVHIYNMYIYIYMYVYMYMYKENVYLVSFNDRTHASRARNIHTFCILAKYLLKQRWVWLWPPQPSKQAILPFPFKFCPSHLGFSREDGVDSRAAKDNRGAMRETDSSKCTRG
jgi:hypothetical protein